MTYKWAKKGFWRWRKYHYQLLDNVAELEFSAPFKLEPKECDVVFSSAKDLNSARGELKTEKGIINYKYNPKIWT